MKRLIGKLVTHSITIQQKLICEQISWQHLNLFNENETDFVTIHESWIYHHDTKLKQELEEVD